MIFSLPNTIVTRFQNLKNDKAQLQIERIKFDKMSAVEKGIYLSGWVKKFAWVPTYIPQRQSLVWLEKYAVWLDFTVCDFEKAALYEDWRVIRKLPVKCKKKLFGTGRNDWFYADQAKKGLCKVPRCSNISPR